MKNKSKTWLIAGAVILAFLMIPLLVTSGGKQPFQTAKSAQAKGSAPMDEAVFDVMAKKFDDSNQIDEMNSHILNENMADLYDRLSERLLQEDHPGIGLWLLSRTGENSLWTTKEVRETYYNRFGKDPGLAEFFAKSGEEFPIVQEVYDEETGEALAPGMLWVEMNFSEVQFELDPYQLFINCEDISEEDRRILEAYNEDHATCVHLNEKPTSEGVLSLHHIGEIGDIVVCETCGKICELGQPMLLKVSHTWIADALEEEGFTGIKEWMRTVEESPQFREDSNFYEGFRFQIAEGEDQPYWRNTGTRIQNGVQFIYEAEQLSILFTEDNCQYRPELAEILKKNLKSGYMVYHTASGGLVQQIELRNSASYEQEDLASKIICTYEGATLKEMEILSPANGKMNGLAKTFSKLQKTTLEAFLGDMGVEAGEAQILYEVMAGERTARGELGTATYTFRRNSRQQSLVITLK
ncbi:MAG: hypothetical protein IJ744_01535 [Lachnospiraceae bacterium]|nr:hypothetical protein [Lachnospiraceae bacterium]